MLFDELTEQLRRLVDEGAPTIELSELDAMYLTEVGAQRPRRRAVTALLALAVMVIAVMVVAMTMLVGDASPTRVATAPSTSSPVPSTTVDAPPPTAAPEPTTTTAALPALATADWHITDDGVGPIKLGMTFEDVARASHASIRTYPNDPFVGLDPEQGSTLQPGDVSLFDQRTGMVSIIGVSSPTIATDVGIRVGSTTDDVRAAYPGAEFQDAGRGSGLFLIDRPGGRVLVLGIDAGVVRIIELCTDRAAFEASTSY